MNDGCKGCLFASKSDVIKSLPILNNLKRELNVIVNADAGLDECSKFVQTFVGGAVEHTSDLDNWTKFLIPWKHSLGGFIQPKLPPGVKVQLGPNPAPCDFLNLGNYPTKNCADKAPLCFDSDGVQCWGFDDIPYNLSDPGNRCVHEAQVQLPTKFRRNILRQFLNVEGGIEQALINTLFVDKSLFSAKPPPKKHASGPKKGKRLTPKENEDWLQRQWDQCLQMIGTTSSVELLLSVCLLTSHAISNKLRTGNPLLIQSFSLSIEQQMLPIKNIKSPISNDYFIFPARLPHMENNLQKGYFDGYSQNLIHEYDRILTETYMTTVATALFSPEQISRLREMDRVVASVYYHMAFGNKSPEELRQMNPIAETDYVKGGVVVVKAGEHYQSFGDYIHHTGSGIYDEEKLPIAETDYVKGGVVVVKAGEQYTNWGQYNHHTGSAIYDKEKMPIAKTDYVKGGVVVVKAGEQYTNWGQHAHHTQVTRRATEKRNEEREYMVAQTDEERIPLYCPDCDITTDAEGNPLMSKYKYDHDGSRRTSAGWKTVVERCYHEQCACSLKPVDESIHKDAIIMKDTMLKRERRKAKKNALLEATTAPKSKKRTLAAAVTDTVTLASSNDLDETSSACCDRSPASIFASLLSTINSSTVLACMVGRLTCDENKMFTIAGDWSIDQSHLSSSDLVNKFELQAVGNDCWDDIDHPPIRGKYIGSFHYGYGAEQQIVPDETRLSFEADNQGGSNICGTGQSKFGSYTVTGKMTSDKRIVMVRCDQPEQLSEQEQRDFDDNFSHFIEAIDVKQPSKRRKCAMEL